MIRPKLALPAMLVLALAASVARAQQALPATENAALRYWMAFAMMQDSPADAETQALLFAVATSNVPWDEQKFGPLVEQNLDAILTMQRATTLPDCNWGLEYALGPETPVAHLVKARVLARLNVLYGMHQLSQKDAGGAVETWLAGLRFSQHLAAGASLVGAITANASLIAHLRALRAAIDDGSLNDSQIGRIDDAAKALPLYGLDWGAAVRYESAATVMALQQFAASADPAGLYEVWFGEPAPRSLTVPSPTQIDQYENSMEKVAAALQQSYPDLPEMASLQAQIGSIHPLIQRSLPSLTRINDRRREAGASRRALLDAISARRR